MLDTRNKVMIISPENQATSKKVARKPYESKLIKDAVKVIRIRNTADFGDEFRDFIVKNLNRGDCIIADDIAAIAKSNQQALRFFEQLVPLGVTLRITEGELVFEPQELVETLKILELCRNVDSQLISHRIKNAKRRGGRPKGRKNSKLKLDKHQDTIIKFSSLKVSHASIAKVVGCHPATVRSWLEVRHPELVKPKQPRKRNTNRNIL